jgi:predicted N-acetyltransferase YhbS
MGESIVQLGAADFGEAMAHLSLVFNDPDFAGLVPALYSPTDAQMKCNFAIRRGGRIAAIVGLFPIDWIVGQDHLRLAGIGGVSVNPEYRGQGLMRLLMDAVMEEVRRGGYHAVCLGGNRRRYAYWGFEKAGVEASFFVTPNSLVHTLDRQAGEGFRLDVAGEADVPAMKHWYESQLIRCERSERLFGKHIRNWRRTPVVMRDEGGSVVGYGCVDAKDDSCVELSVADVRALDGFLFHQVLGTGRTLRVTLPVLQTDVFHRVSELSDDVSLIEASNWRIYDWPSVVGALLRVKQSVEGLLSGSCVLRVGSPGGRGESEGLRLSVDGSVRCERSDEHPDLELEAGELLRAMAGPLPPRVAGGTECLLKWRPLPLMIPMQDRI